jgi:hypothetical protein
MEVMTEQVRAAAEIWPVAIRFQRGLPVSPRGTRHLPPDTNFHFRADYLSHLIEMERAPIAPPKTTV